MILLKNPLVCQLWSAYCHHARGSGAVMIAESPTTPGKHRSCSLMVKTHIHEVSAQPSTKVGRDGTGSGPPRSIGTDERPISNPCFLSASPVLGCSLDRTTRLYTVLAQGGPCHHAPLCSIERGLYRRCSERTQADLAGSWLPSVTVGTVWKMARGFEKEGPANVFSVREGSHCWGFQKPEPWEF